MSHRLWGLHLAGLVLKKGGHEITPKKDSLLWKGGDGGKNQIILRKNKSSGLGKTPQGDNTKESQQKLPNTLALSGPALLSELLFAVFNSEPAPVCQFVHRSRTRDPVLTCAVGKQEPLC